MNVTRGSASIPLLEKNYSTKARVKLSTYHATGTECTNHVTRLVDNSKESICTKDRSYLQQKMLFKRIYTDVLHNPI